MGSSETRKGGAPVASGGGYGLAMLGALVYFLSEADDIGDGLWGALKAIAWPATLTYEVLRYIGA